MTADPYQELITEFDQLIDRNLTRDLMTVRVERLRLLMNLAREGVRKFDEFQGAAE